MIGGEIGKGPQKNAVCAVYSSDETIEGWQPEPLLNRGRASLGVAVLDDKLYAVGGRDQNESKYFERLNDVFSAFSWNVCKKKTIIVTPSNICSVQGCHPCSVLPILFSFSSRDNVIVCNCNVIGTTIVALPDLCLAETFLGFWRSSHFPSARN